VTDDRHYDVIITGTGAGGGTLAHRLAPSGKRILLLERGPIPQARTPHVSSVVMALSVEPNPTQFQKAGAERLLLRER
jgi:choline dehydrogenase-like flavoprotein